MGYRIINEVIQKRGILTKQVYVKYELNGEIFEETFIIPTKPFKIVIDFLEYLFPIKTTLTDSETEEEIEIRSGFFEDPHHRVLDYLEKNKDLDKATREYLKDWLKRG